MKKRIIVCVALLILLVACSTENIPEPERCSLCDDRPRHAPCIINLSTGELLELDVYEPHPFLVGEIAEEQRGGNFSFVRGAGVKGYKLGAESVIITIPVKSDKMDQRYFCSSCRELLSNHTDQGYILADLYDPRKPIAYAIHPDIKVAFRYYEISVQEVKEDSEYELTINGTLYDANYPVTD